ncbi:hypothetical protein INT45_004552, partial [Circinella minor]
LGELESGGITPPLNDSQETAALPTPELSNLPEILNILNNAKTLQDKDRLASFIVPENYIDKLLPIFESCEDLEIFLNDNTIIEQIIRDETIIGVLGILEYDPEIPDKRATHRKNLLKHSQLEPVVPIENKTVNSKIQQTLRLKYLKDVILGDTIDDSLVSILHSLIFFNNIDIINYFESNHDYLDELFEIFRDNDASNEKKKEASKFVIQLCIMARAVQTSARAGLARTLAKHGLFDMFPFALCVDDEILRTHATNILASILELDAYLFREYTIEQTRTMDPENTTLGTVLRRFALDTDPGLKIQFAEIIKASMDLGNGTMVASTMAAEMLRKQDPDTEIYLTVFYDNYCNLFLRPFETLDVKPIKLDGPIEELELTQDQSDLCLYLCDLICFVIRQHSFRSKYLIRSTDCFVKIIQLYRCKHSHIKLAALRVFRTCIGLMDEFYTRHLIKFNIFEPTIRVFLDTDGRDNLLNSACLELVEFIRRENIKSLVEHLITNYGSVLDTINYVTICKMLRLRHEQNIEPDDSNISETKGNNSLERGNGQDITLDDAAAEEEYFNNQSSDEEDHSNEISLTSTDKSKDSQPLVNYGGSDSSDDEMESDEQQQQQSSPSLSSSPTPPSSEQHTNTNNNNHNHNHIEEEDNNNMDTTMTTVTTTNTTTSDDEETKTKSPSPSSPLSTTTESDRLTSPPPLPKRRLNDEDDDEDDVLAAKADTEIEVKQ